jgi:hypothetical protein
MEAFKELAVQDTGGSALMQGAASVFGGGRTFVAFFVSFFGSFFVLRGCFGLGG